MLQTAIQVAWLNISELAWVLHKQLNDNRVNSSILKQKIMAILTNNRMYAVGLNNLIYKIIKESSQLVYIDKT